MTSETLNKIKIIYLVGVGHTGSTIIEKIINTSPFVYSVGETKHLRDRFLEKGRELLPAASEAVSYRGYIDPRKSDFWNPIINEIEKKDLKIYCKKSSHFERIKIFFNILLGRLKKEKENYEEESFYHLIFNQAKKFKAQTHYILDSSKDLRRAYYLLQKPLIDLYVIHITRDVRGVVNSQEKFGKNWLSTAFQWLALNFITRIFMKRFMAENKYMTISYDAFAQCPVKYIEIMNKKLRLDIDTENYLQKINEDASQRFSGNKMLYQKVEAIKYDQKWKRELPAWKKIFLSALFYLPNKTWVFNKNID